MNIYINLYHFTKMGIQNIMVLIMTFKFWTNGELINTCNPHDRNSSIISCGPGHTHTLIALHCVFASEEIVKYLLEHCNGQYHCQVPKLKGNCVQGVYGCTEVARTLEITPFQSNAMMETAPWLGVRSAGYSQGQYTDAKNIYCDLRSLYETRGQWQGIQFDVYELAPFATSPHFCLSAADVDGQIFCSGSKRMFEFLRFNKIRDVRDGWQFNLTLAKEATHAPKVRFWFGVRVWPHAGNQYKLECRSSGVQIKGCGGNLTEPRGVISSPQFSQDYPARMCEWYITMEEGNTLSLFFTKMRMNICVECGCNNVKVYDGTTPDSKLLGKFCGDSIPEQINSTGNSMQIVFESDAASGSASFEAIYNANVQTDPEIPVEKVFEDHEGKSKLTEIHEQNDINNCGGDFYNKRGVIKSPSYPSTLYGNINCEWNITLKEGKTVSLLFTELNLSNCSNCSCDYVKVYDSKFDGNLLGTFCGSSLPDLINTTQNSLRLVLKINATNQTSAQLGFQAAYFVTIPSEPFLGNVETGDGKYNIFIPVSVVLCFLTAFFACAFIWAVLHKRRSSRKQIGLFPNLPKPIPPMKKSDTLPNDNMADYDEICDYAQLSTPDLNNSDYLEPVVHYQTLTNEKDKCKANGRVNDLYSKPIKKAQRAPRDSDAKLNEYLEILPDINKPNL